MKSLMLTLMLLGASLAVSAAESPVSQIAPVPVTAKFSDPAYQIWCGSMVEGNDGNFTKAGQSLALFESRDGFAWTLSNNPLVSRLDIPWAGKDPQPVSALERPQLWLRNGKPEIMFCAVAVDKKRTETFNVAIPLTIDR